MAESNAPPPGDPTDVSGWDFAGARRHHLAMGLRMTPAERLRWLEETVEEMGRLVGRARGARRIPAEPANR